jgi:triacylglycerol lipase
MAGGGLERPGVRPWPRTSPPGRSTTRLGIPSPLLAVLVLALAAVTSVVAVVATPAGATEHHEDPPLSVPRDRLESALACPDGAEERPVLLVHGTGTTPEENFGWNYAEVLPELGFDVCTVRLPNRALDDIQVASEYVVHAIREMHAASGARVQIIGHSQGGLEPRWALRWWPSLREQVADVITLASPHHGTLTADSACAGGACSPAVWQMRTAATFIELLNSQDQTPGPVNYTSIWSLTDELVQPVVPESVAVLDGGDNTSNVLIQEVCPGRPVEHVQFAYDAAVFEVVMDALEHPGPAETARVDRSACAEYAFEGVELDATAVALLEQALDPQRADLFPTNGEPEPAPYTSEGDDEDPERDDNDDRRDRHRDRDDAHVSAGATTGRGAAASPAGQPTWSVLVANVGNVNPSCAEQVFKLCHLAVEDRIAERIAAIDPDVVALTEVLPPELCDDATVSAASPYNSCSLETQEPPQAVRLLGEDYAVACADVTPWDCLAVHHRVGSIDACPEGYCGPALETVTAPDGCDQGFQGALADVELDAIPIRVIVAHPDSMDEDCRSTHVRAMFDHVPQDRETLLLGDMNLDPYRDSPEDDPSVAVWNEHVGAGGTFAYLSGIAEHDPPYFTLVPAESQALDPTGEVTDGIAIEDEWAYAGTVDHVAATRGLGGSCVTLGEAPGTERLDGGGGMDHRALDCRVGPADRSDGGEPPRDGAGAAAAPNAPHRTLPTTGPASPVTYLVGPLLLLAAAALRRRPDRP